MSYSIQHKFFTLLRYSIGSSVVAPNLSFSELKEIYGISRKQALTGVILDGVKRMDFSNIHLQEGEKDAYEDLVMKWICDGVKIARRNDRVNKNLAVVFHQFEKNGFECCLLKGQGIAFLYPHLDERTSGDIDVWLRPVHNTNDFCHKDLKDSKDLFCAESDIKKVIDFVRSYDSSARAIYHHIDCPSYNGTEVEVHYRPHFMQNLLHNARLQQFFLEHADEQFTHKVQIGDAIIAVPTREFNIIFQLSHIYQHLFHERIGLRQILDYYYVLQSSTNGELLISNEQLFVTLDRLGLQSIGGAICWILVNCFGMDKSLCVVPPDERRGRFVLSEILAGGNFGKYDSRKHFGNSAVGKNLDRLLWDARLLCYFPNEALSEPLFRIYHWFWRRKYNR